MVVQKLSFLSQVKSCALKCGSCNHEISTQLSVVVNLLNFVVSLRYMQN